MANSKKTRFSCDASRSGRPFPHFWEHTVGSGHAALGLRTDWQRQLARCRRELGFRHVRFHGLLCDDMGTLMCEQGKEEFSFFNADQIWDFLLSIGMRPFVELSFMPSTLASGAETVFHYRGNVTPPRALSKWADLVLRLARHWIERYGEAEVAHWFFEVWNEPNLKAFWTGTQNDYFRLYEATSKALKKASPALCVGGPATAQDAWVPEFLGYCRGARVAVDFVSTHHYPTDAFGKPGDDTLTQLAKSRRSVLRARARRVKRQAGSKPVYYTEWSSSSNPFDDLHDRPFAASFAAKTVLEATGLVAGYSWWTFSDIFEENYFSSVPFHGGFGLLTIHGIPKPVYRAFELLHHLGTRRLTVRGRHATVDAWAFRNGDTISVLLTNFALPRHPISTEAVTIRLDRAEKPRAVFAERIDDNHANARRAWEQMGSPESLNPREVDALEAASRVTKEPIGWRRVAGAVELAVDLAPQSVTCLTIEGSAGSR